MANTALSQVAASKPRLPVEACERIIDAVYDNRYSLVQTALATLSNCALVCRAWRAPAQKVLFEYVVLTDKDALYAFAELLDASPELGRYVISLALRGYLRVPFSPAVLFPTILRGRLTNLLHLYIFELDNDAKAAKPLPAGVKELPILPMHRYFPFLFTSISHIRRLVLFGVVFPSFADFARILCMLPNLRELYCNLLSWAVLSLVPRFMAKRGSHDSKKTFLPHLELLQCVRFDSQGTHRLVDAIGLSLRSLWLDFRSIHSHPAVEEPKKTPRPLDLRSFPRLDNVLFYLEPLAQPHDSMLATLQETLILWATPNTCKKLRDSPPSVRRQYLYLRPRRPLFRREEYVQLLRIVGPVVEAALCSQTPSADGANAPHNAVEGKADAEGDPCRADVVIQDLADRLEWADWWRTRVQECFPTFAKWKRLEVDPSHDDNPGPKWMDHEQTPGDLPTTAPTAQCCVS